MTSPLAGLSPGLASRTVSSTATPFNVAAVASAGAPGQAAAGRPASAVAVRSPAGRGTAGADLPQTGIDRASRPSQASPPELPRLTAARDLASSALSAIEGARRRLDGALQAARGGRTFTAAELLALQSDAYRFSQTLDVAARTVEAGAQSIRQATSAQT